MDNPCRCISHKTVTCFSTLLPDGLLLTESYMLSLFIQWGAWSRCWQYGWKQKHGTNFFTQEKSVGSVYMYLAFSLTYNILVRQSRLQHMKNKIWRSKFPLKSWSCPIGKTMIGRHNNRILYVCVHVFMFSPVIWCPHRKLQREETKREMGVSKGSNNGFKRGVS